MHSTLGSFAFAAVALTTVAAAPSGAHAQRRLDPVRVTGEQVARADALHAEAVKFEGTLSAMRKVARLHEGSAALRTADDPQNFACLHTAALLRYYSGDRRAGGERMEEAADNASARGDVISAANAYIDAAIIAREFRDGERMLALSGKADLLTNSPLISESQRLALRERLSSRPSVAMLDRP